MDYGATPNGFVRMRLPEIQEDLFKRYEAKVGQPVSRKPNSVIGVIIGLLAYESDLQWQLEEANYYARSPMTADEGSIDNTLSYTNVIRRAAEHTYLFLVCYGRNNMILPANCQVKDASGEKYNIDGQSQISLDNCVSVTLNVQFAVGRKYDIVLDNDLHVECTSKADDNLSRVHMAILSQIGGKWSASIQDGNIVLERDDRRYGGSVVVSESFSVLRVGTPIKFIAENAGPVEPVLNTVTNINTNYDGWYSVSNESDAYVGRSAETITELRQRYASAVYKQSMTMKESVKAAVMDLTDVQACTVYENRSDEVVDGMLPHSVEVIVHGGDDLEIATTIVQRLSAGIDTNGTVEVLVEDSEGTQEKVRFNRPIEIPIHVLVKVYEYKEETLPGDLVNIIKNIVVSEGAALGMGKDVIAQRFVGPIYKGTNGIGYIELSVSADGASYTDKSIVIDRNEVSSFRADNVTVVMEL